MNLLKAAELKVGLMVLGIASLIVYMSLQVTEDPSFIGKTNRAWFVAPDANGLVKNSAVKTAGIAVGVIRDITLYDGMARIDLTLKSNIKLTTSAAVAIKSQGILGDNYIDVYPGSPSDPPLPPNGQILNVKSQGNLDNVISQVGDIAGSLKEVAKVLKESVAEDGTRKHVLGRIVLNIEKLTEDVAAMTTVNREKINDIVDQVNRISKTIDDALNDESDAGFKKTWKRALARIDSTLKNVDEISSKINRGEGTIGRLVNDESTVEELNTAIDGINGFLDTGNKLQTGIDFNSYYLGQIGGAKSTIGIKLQPGLDRYYYIGVVDDPAGVVETTRIASTTGGVTTDTKEVKTFSNKTKFSLMFAKNYYDFTVRGGLIENSGGVGFDYMLYRDKLKWSLELYEFSKLNVRTQLQYNLYKGIYFAGGWSDALNNSGRISTYIGAGLFITNDDLKLLSTKIPLMN